MFYNVEDHNRVESKYPVRDRSKLLRPDFHHETSKYQSELMFRRDEDYVMKAWSPVIYHLRHQYYCTMFCYSSTEMSCHLLSKTFFYCQQLYTVLCFYHFYILAIFFNQILLQTIFSLGLSINWRKGFPLF